MEVTGLLIQIPGNASALERRQNCPGPGRGVETQVGTRKKRRKTGFFQLRKDSWPFVSGGALHPQEKYAGYSEGRWGKGGLTQKSGIQLWMCCGWGAKGGGGGGGGKAGGGRCCACAIWLGEAVEKFD